MTEWGRLDLLVSPRWMTFSYEKRFASEQAIWFNLMAGLALNSTRFLDRGIAPIGEKM